MNRVCATARHQRGQALVFGLFVLIAGLAALFFFFNVGQLSREKTKLVNAADAVAYSAGVVHARALNFNAYSNRALIANEVLIAQMVSMHSWAAYMKSWDANLDQIHPECAAAAESDNPYAYVGAGLLSLTKYGPDYFVACIALALLRKSGNGVVQTTADMAQGAIETTAVPFAEFNKQLITAAQSLINTAGMLADRESVMDAVAKANYAGDGEVRVDLLALTLPDDWLRLRGASGGSRTFIRKFEGDERTRFKEVAVTAANTDPFIRERSWTSRALLPKPDCVLNWKLDEVRRRGGTEMLGFDEWKAVDTQSYHENYRSKFFSFGCDDEDEHATGIASSEAYKGGARQGAGGASFGGSRSGNPGAHWQAVSNAESSAMGYGGLPNYYDLNPIWLRDRPNDEPTLLYGVRLTRSKANLRTTDGTTGQIHTRADSRIGAYESAVAGGEMAAVSGSEVFFERPPSQADNLFGARTGRPRELGSLFNPYWQVRLASVDPRGEWLRQGVTP